MEGFGGGNSYSDGRTQTDLFLLLSVKDLSCKFELLIMKRQNVSP